MDEIERVHRITVSAGGWSGAWSIDCSCTYPSLASYLSEEVDLEDLNRIAQEHIESSKTG